MYKPTLTSVTPKRHEERTLGIEIPEFQFSAVSVGQGWISLGKIVSGW
jgi:hypothetical protein